MGSKETAATAAAGNEDAAYEAIDKAGAAPLWRYYGGLFEPEPKSKAVPYLWSYKVLRPHLFHFVDRLSLKEAERRVLMLVNPGLREPPATVNTLFAGYQIIVPGEDAHAHRHASGAFRFIVEGESAVTTVEGERVWMRPGDLLLTPSWHWHDHRHEGDQPMVWLDGLDYPLINGLEAGFFEPYHERLQESVVADDLSSRQFIHGQLVPEWEQRKGLNSPIGKYPWVETKAAFDAIGDDVDGTETDGIILQYTNPWNGGPVMPTIACYVQRLRPGFHSACHRHTTNTIHIVVSGSGRTVVDGEALDWKEHDVFAIPTWTAHEHLNTSDEDALVFSFSDSPVMRSLGLYREQALPRQA
jgi:gentisate 1,2-dioxygenase